MPSVNYLHWTRRTSGGLECLTMISNAVTIGSYHTYRRITRAFPSYIARGRVIAIWQLLFVIMAVKGKQTVQTNIADNRVMFELRSYLPDLRLPFSCYTGHPGVTAIVCQ